MYAIVEIAGQQFKVEEGKKIFVHRLDVNEGEELDFDQVLLLDEDGKVSVGDPTVKDASVQAKVVDNVKGDKVIVFKKKRKKGYRIKNGHRQQFTQVEILSINGKGASAKKAVKKEKAEALQEETIVNHTEKVKPEAKKTAAPARKPAEKKSAEKNPAEKKTTSSRKAKE
ncbi:MAG: 50S ribosomal protein L21 [Bacteroidales bacterium]|nr:50S ribosomal protein L21 [Bacteroidales bacterium]MBN2632031.1 50S ribosomal protein L21 [Bacteroidales bacterium]